MVSGSVTHLSLFGLSEISAFVEAVMSFFSGVTARMNKWEPYLEDKQKHLTTEGRGRQTTCEMIE